MQTGDFGRPKPSLWNDVVLTETGSLAAKARGEPVSSFMLTDDEGELRDRAWRFLMPAHERAWFERILAELARTRVLPPSARSAPPDAYHDAVLAEEVRSPASAYRRLSEDAAADGALIAPFAATARRVAAADRARLRALAFVRHLSEADIRDAAARVAENRCLVAWVRASAWERLDQYRFALEHLVIEAPQGQAIPAERSLAALAGHLAALDGVVAGESPCAGPLPAHAAGAAVLVTK